MKKHLMKFLLWDHFCQVMFIISTIPTIYFAIKGKGHFISGLVVGFNWGCALYWQFYLAERNRKRWWQERALAALAPPDNLQGFLDQAKGLVAARIKSNHINPDHN